eukprot:9865_1
MSVYHVGDIVDFNSDPDSDDEAHNYNGKIVAIDFASNQISIKLSNNSQQYTYFLDEINIQQNTTHSHIHNETDDCKQTTTSITNSIDTQQSKTSTEKLNDSKNDDEKEVFVVCASYLSFYSKLWKVYEKKWIKLSSNNTITVHKNKNSNKIDEKVDLNIHNEIIRLPNTTKLKKNDFQFQFKKFNEKQVTRYKFRFRANTEEEFTTWMKYIAQCKTNKNLKPEIETKSPKTAETQENENNKQKEENEEIKIDRYQFNMNTIKSYANVETKPFSSDITCSCIEDCDGLKRLSKTLQFYQEFNHKNCNDKDINKFVKYLVSNKEYIVNDYHHI